MITARNRELLVWVLAAVLVATLPVKAGPLPCDDLAFRVEAKDSVTLEMICSVASDAKESLATCGLVPVEPIETETVKSPIHGIGMCLAAFDCDRGRIRIFDPALLRDNLLADDPYAHLPDDVVFRSLLTHELAHALVQQASGDRVVPLVDHAFIANALELAALAPEHRKTLLDAAGTEPPISAEMIDVFIYGLAPRRFAAAPYLYFKEFGCETITQILDGTATFWVEPQV